MADSEGQQVRWIFALNKPATDQPGRAEVHAFETGVSYVEVVAELSEVVHQYMRTIRQNPQQTFLSHDQVQVLQRVQEIARDYPAAFWANPDSESPIYLCAACQDVYDVVLKDKITRIPKNIPGPIPCTFHFDPSLAPMPYEEALEIKQQYEDAQKMDEQPPSGAEDKTVKKTPPKKTSKKRSPRKEK